MLERLIPPIDRIDQVLVRLPFVKPFSISTATWTCKEALLLRIESEGVTAWGECVADPDPYYASETTLTAGHILRDFLLPLVESNLPMEALAQRFRRVRGHGMAKATIENALLDLIAKREGLPLHALLGYPARPIPSGISIGIQDTEDSLLEAVGEAVASGYHRVKMKIRRGCDIDRVAAVRERFPDIALMADANGDYSLEDAVHLRQLDAFGLTMIEQPLSYSDIYEHSLLQNELRTPLCLDESIHNLADARTAIDLGSCRVINVKQGRVGGLAEALRISQYAASKGVPVWSGGMDETGIGRAVNIHLQTAPFFSIPGDTSETARYFARDLVTPPVVLDADGFIAVPAGPGIGVQIDADALKDFTLETMRLR
ncbi:MAG TPA: o-succinylbenzoate synthase [Thermoanaerobaculia bacterium]|nr:o-succinylbenzoate synthase [Thermoanaerobaculia bacterium]